MKDFVRISELVGTAVYGLVSMALLLISLAMVGIALWDIWRAIVSGGDVVRKLLDAIGLIVIAMAVFDVSKYFLEEEVLRDRELRSAHEARATLTKFLVILSIAVSLEALVFIFGAGKEDLRKLVYPTLLLVAAVLVVVGLGVYQRLSRDVESSIEARRTTPARGEESAQGRGRQP